MNIYTEFKQMFKLPTPLEVAAAQLATAELELLKAETGVEYAGSMVAFNKAQIKRLKSYIAAKAVEVTE
jgi:L-lactate utilization protein LutC